MCVGAASDFKTLTDRVAFAKAVQPCLDQVLNGLHTCASSLCYTCMRTYIHTYVSAYIGTYVLTYICTYVVKHKRYG